MLKKPYFSCVCGGCLVLFAYLLFVMCGISASAEIVIPRRQSKPPNKPYTPSEAIAKMTVPDGFTVELVASEPDIVNPVAMTFDERGRVWITESLEYPRKEAGQGRDRVKILADADGDGTYEQVKIFADGLNIPSGIAVGAGGVWVANAPDILFYPDANRDDVPDGPPQVVVTGFGRDDTHELPNSLTWGPDGYLYGLNGVFNPSHVEQNGKKFDFTCAMFRIHPRTHEFSLFCEGTSNPWGIAFNDRGDAFISACVIDHLWHLVETGYYHRQGGAYPPFVWKLGSIVDYRHQMAAYCGIHWFDSDAYPEQYREKLYMGNIHGGCINVDRLERNGATYRGWPESDFLTANDAWFMPVAQKTGPDGCLYVLDWYDRYHCYQDAKADPDGIDRLKGRLYRVRYRGAPRAPKFDLAQETDDQLIERLKSPNLFYRDLAQRLLRERNDPATVNKLETIILEDDTPRKIRMHALWSCLGRDSLNVPFAKQLLAEDEPLLRAWSVRALGEKHLETLDITQAVSRLAGDRSSDVRLQVAIAAPKLHTDGGVSLLFDVSESTDADPIIARILWQNLLSLLPVHRKEVLAELERRSHATSSTDFEVLLTRTFCWLLAQEDGVEEAATIIVRLFDDPNQVRTANGCLSALAERLESGELGGKHEAVMRRLIEDKAVARVNSSEIPLSSALTAVLCHWKNSKAIHTAQQVVDSATDANEQTRLEFLDAWASSRDPALVESMHRYLAASSGNSPIFCRRVFEVLTKYDHPDIAKHTLTLIPLLENDLKPAALELLTSRVSWSNLLIDAIVNGQLSKDEVSVNQIRKMLKSGDQPLARRVEEIWGKLRTDRNPQREKVLADMKQLLTGSQGDAVRGQVVFNKLCGQCHKLHGQGQDVGPDLTVNGRGSFEQLVANVFDPSLVIGNAYRTRTVVTSHGLVLTGLLVEDNPQRIVLKLQGNKLEAIAREDVEEIEVSSLSLMPEGIEKQLQPQEVIDLFALLKLDKPPSDPQAKPLPNFTELK